MIFDGRDPLQLETALTLHPLFGPAFNYWQSLCKQGLPLTKRGSRKAA